MVIKSETMAYDWLIKKGYTYKDIKKNGKQTPDFICSDGKRYEVKTVYGNRIVIFDHQYESLKPTDIILVFDKKGFVTKFLWKDKSTTKINVRINNVTPLIGISKETKTELDNLKEYPIETYSDVVKRLINIKKLFDEVRK